MNWRLWVCRYLWHTRKYVWSRCEVCGVIEEEYLREDPGVGL